MTEPLFAVFSGGDHIQAVFSTENLAQLHAAKLRTGVGETSSEKSMYTVGVLPVDMHVNEEPHYSAYLETPLGEVHGYKYEEIECSREEDLVETLPESYVEEYTWGADQSQYLGFNAFGWSPEHAIEQVERMVFKYINEHPEEA